jgi:biotin operon repressor
MAGAGLRSGQGRANKQTVAELMAQDISLPVIAHRLGCSRQYVYRLVADIKKDLGWLGD